MVSKLIFLEFRLLLSRVATYLQFVTTNFLKYLNERFLKIILKLFEISERTVLSIILKLFEIFQRTVFENYFKIVKSLSDC